MSRFPDFQISRFFGVNFPHFQNESRNLQIWRSGNLALKNLEMWKVSLKQSANLEIWEFEFALYVAVGVWISKFPDLFKLAFQISRFCGVNFPDFQNESG